MSLMMAMMTRNPVSRFCFAVECPFLETRTNTRLTERNSQLQMKSAYELAMERLQKQAPEVKLTDAQRAKLGELDVLYKAKRAEREVFLRGEIAKAEARGDGEALESLQKQLAHDLRRIEEELETKKEKVRSGGK